ncbi:MAG: glycosyltransferase [Candidatus Bathyarchaeota archaeon]|nr:glycosyltransferase [Candidatus Bathyarchaeota archaeon]
MIAEKPLVSVIIPTHNYGHLINETIESVLNQTYDNIEIIVVDDGSKDNTHNVVAAYPKVRYIYQEHEGNHTPARAMNKGISVSRGEYIVCLGADDKLTASYIEKCVRKMQQSSRTGIVYTGTQEFGCSSEMRFPRKPRHKYSVLRHPHGQLGAMMVRREVYLPVSQKNQLKKAKTVGLYDEDLHGLEDWDFVIRASLAGWKIESIPELLHQTRVHRGGRVTYHANEGEIYQKHPFIKGYIFVSRLFDIITLFFTKPKVFLNRLWNKGVCRIFCVQKIVEPPEKHQHVWINENSILKKVNGLRVLDCGCGTGRWGYLLKKKGKDVVGVDIYRPYISQAKRHETVVLASIVFLPFKSASFDVGLAVELIEHLPKEQGIVFLHELRRVSKRVVLTTPKNFEPIYFGEDHPETHRSVWEASEILKALDIKLNTRKSAVECKENTM